MNSIERIEAVSLISNGTAPWKYIKVAENILSPRKNCLAVAINDRQIAILGGYAKNEFEHHGPILSGDIIIFD